MEILAAVTARLSALGYTVTETDSAALDYNIKKAETTLKVRTNQLEVPEGLFYVWAELRASVCAPCKASACSCSWSFKLSSLDTWTRAEAFLSCLSHA